MKAYYVSMTNEPKVALRSAFARHLSCPWKPVGVPVMVLHQTSAGALLASIIGVASGFRKRMHLHSVSIEPDWFELSTGEDWHLLSRRIAHSAELGFAVDSHLGILESAFLVNPKHERWSEIAASVQYEGRVGRWAEQNPKVPVH